MLVEAKPKTPADGSSVKTRNSVKRASHTAHKGIEKEFLHNCVASPLNKTTNIVLKRVVDVAVSFVLVVAIFPWFLPLVALLIKLDSKGPVFFFQKRQKQGGRLFTCIKLRTMIVNEQADTLGAFEGDTRITRAGRLLRKTHLDELPQLLNVLLGDMSLIGPRPHMISDNQMFETVIGHYHLRHYVKPGITGLAQVQGHVGATMEVEVMKVRVAHDLYYINSWSPGMDIRIIGKTISKMLEQMVRGKK